MLKFVLLHLIKDKGRYYGPPTIPFTTVELYNPSHDVPEVHKTLRSLDVQALKLSKGRPGHSTLITLTKETTLERDASRQVGLSLFGLDELSIF